jgi:hypothetical protein
VQGEGRREKSVGCRVQGLELRVLLSGCVPRGASPGVGQAEGERERREGGRVCVCVCACACVRAGET